MDDNQKAEELLQSIYELEEELKFMESREDIFLCKRDIENLKREYKELMKGTNE